MIVNKADKINCENLTKLLRRAKIELQGAEEILGTAEVLKWTSGLLYRISTDLEAQEEKAKTMEAVVSATPIESLEPPKTEKKTKAKKSE